MSTRVEVEDAFFSPSTLTSSLWLVVGLTALLKTTLRACALEEQAARRCPISGRAPQGRSGRAPGKGLLGVASSLPLSQPQAPFSSFPGFSDMLPDPGAPSPSDSFSLSSFAPAVGRSRTILF